MFLNSNAARASREQWASAHAHQSRYWFSDAGQLLQDSRVVSLMVADSVSDPALHADLGLLATAIEHHLVDTLSVLGLSRRDVELTFDRLRASHRAWPKAIPAESWRRLERTRYLDDISDVVLGGGDFWMAIEYALLDEFGGTA